jgi:hypothetical protein
MHGNRLLPRKPKCGKKAFYYNGDIASRHAFSHGNTHLMPQFHLLRYLPATSGKTVAKRPFVAIGICGDSLFQQHLFCGVCHSMAIANCCNTLWQQLLFSWI